MRSTWGPTLHKESLIALMEHAYRFAADLAWACCLRKLKRAWSRRVLVINLDQSHSRPAAFAGGVLRVNGQ